MNWAQIVTLTAEQTNHSTLDTLADANVLPTCVHKMIFQDFSLEKLGPKQTQLKVYKSTGMNVTGFVLYVPKHLVHWVV